MSKPLYMRKRLWSALAVAALIILIALRRHNLADALARLNWDDYRNAILATGPLAPLLCILLYAFVTVFFLPTTAMGIIVALLYGPWLGLPIVLAGLALGVAISFLAARHLLRRPIERRLGSTRLYRRIEHQITREGWKLVFFTRILPVNPFALLNYLYGLTRIRFWPFLLASVVGLIPNAIIVLWTTHAAGQIAAGHLDWRIFLLLFAGALLFAAVSWLPRLIQRNKPDAILRDDPETHANPP